MKLYFLDQTSRAAINVRRLKNYGYDTWRIMADNVEALDKLIVLGDGSPEDEVMGILSSHLDGDRIIGIVKPQRHHLDAMSRLKEYINSKIRKIMVVIDQDTLNLNMLFTLAVTKIQELGISVQERNSMDETARVRTYNCSLPGKHFDIIVVVSGLEEVHTSKHTIEDHLLRIVGIDEVENSKECWASLDTSDKEDVFRMLMNEDVANVSFPQHVYGCKCLEQNCAVN